jgi:aerotaxis receptor
MKEYNASEFFFETEVPEGETIVSRTDLNGRITYANDVFAHISGYSVDELIGKPHSVVRHPDMPRRAFKKMWEDLQSSGRWEGVVKNMRKDTGYYWVYAIISGVYKEGKLVEYKSLRKPISNEQKIEFQKKYDQMRNIDKDNIRTVVYKD